MIIVYYTGNNNIIINNIRSDHQHKYILAPTLSYRLKLNHNNFNVNQERNVIQQQYSRLSSLHKISTK